MTDKKNTSIGWHTLKDSLRLQGRTHLQVLLPTELE